MDDLEPEELRVLFDRALCAWRADGNGATRARSLAEHGLCLGEKLWTERHDRTALEELLATTLAAIEGTGELDLIARWVRLCARVEPVGQEAREGHSLVTRWLAERRFGRRSKGRARLLELHGRLLERLDVLDAASASYAAALELDLSNPPLLWPTAQLARRSGDLAREQRLLRMLLLQRLDRSSPMSTADVHTRLGESFEQQGLVPSALEEYQRALARAPEHQAARAHLERLRG